MHHVLVDQMRLALDRCDEKKEDKQDKYDRHRDTHADHYAVLQDENVLEIHLKYQSFISILIKG